MYDLVRPRIAVPVHGELRHMLAHERLAREHGIPETVVGENGALIRLAPGPAAIIDTVQSGRLALDGNRMVSLDSEVFKERSRMLFNGVAIASAVLDRTRRNEPEVHLSTVGLLQAGDERLTSAAAAAAAKAIDELADKTYNDDDAVRETVKLVVRRTFRHFLEKRPLTCVHVIRL
jgi:ribonuclease J